MGSSHLKRFFCAARQISWPRTLMDPRRCPAGAVPQLLRRVHVRRRPYVHRGWLLACNSCIPHSQWIRARASCLLCCSGWRAGGCWSRHSEHLDPGSTSSSAIAACLVASGSCAAIASEPALGPRTALQQDAFEGSRQIEHCMVDVMKQCPAANPQSLHLFRPPWCRADAATKSCRDVVRR